MDKQLIISHIREALIEISRVNRAAGETVFNPAAREGLLAVVESLEAPVGPRPLEELLTSEDSFHVRGKTISLPKFGPVGKTTLVAVFRYVHAHPGCSTTNVAAHFGFTDSEAYTVLTNVPTATAATTGRAVIWQVLDLSDADLYGTLEALGY
jgi:hypothetical protein